jgi:hypothetical protein
MPPVKPASQGRLGLSWVFGIVFLAAAAVSGAALTFGVEMLLPRWKLIFAGWICVSAAAGLVAPVAPAGSDVPTDVMFLPGVEVLAAIKALPGAGGLVAADVLEDPATRVADASPCSSAADAVAEGQLAVRCGRELNRWLSLLRVSGVAES